uniref:Cytochrome P450 n=1 Tax=Macrostomum lignano TaxID=282301 RepID=A0A1I8FQE6_9PLAT
MAVHSLILTVSLLLLTAAGTAIRAVLQPARCPRR